MPARDSTGNPFETPVCSGAEMAEMEDTPLRRTWFPQMRVTDAARHNARQSIAVFRANTSNRSGRVVL